MVLVVGFDEGGVVERDHRVDRLLRHSWQMIEFTRDSVPRMVDRARRPAMRRGSRVDFIMNHDTRSISRYVLVTRLDKL